MTRPSVISRDACSMSCIIFGYGTLETGHTCALVCKRAVRRQFNPPQTSLARPGQVLATNCDSCLPVFRQIDTKQGSIKKNPGIAWVHSEPMVGLEPTTSCLQNS